MPITSAPPPLPHLLDTACATSTVAPSAPSGETPAQVLADMIAETNQRLRLERRTAGSFRKRADALFAACTELGKGSALAAELGELAEMNRGSHRVAADRADTLARHLGTLRAALAISEAVAATPAQKARAEVGASRRSDNSPMAAEALIDTLNEAGRRGFRLDPKLVAP